MTKLTYTSSFVYDHVEYTVPNVSVDLKKNRKQIRTTITTGHSLYKNKAAEKPYPSGCGN